MSAAARILVVGRTGQLAQALMQSGRPGLSFAGRPEADLAAPSTLRAAVEKASPHAVINAGAYTSVDGAETDAANAFAINRDGPAELAHLCAARGIPLVHVSTDCVFDGRKAAPYEPGDMPAPLSVYGHSKWEGEQAVAAACPRHLIVRVSWVFSEYAGNFVKTMLTLARTRDTVTVVSDQFGYPTYCPDIARGLLKMADVACAPEFSAYGTYHLAGDEAIDRARMAERVYAESARLGGPVAAVKAVPTMDYPTPAARPLNARLASQKALDTFGLTMPDWTLGLTATVRDFVDHLAPHSTSEQG